MTIKAPDILTTVPEADYSFLRELARKHNTSVSILAGEILSEAVSKARQKTVKKRPPQSLDEVLAEVQMYQDGAAFNGSKP